MKALVCIGVTVEHAMADAAIACACAMSRDADIAVYFNGTPIRPVPAGVETTYSPTIVGQERGLWQWAYGLALARGMDWCVILHDDMLLVEPWEDELEEAAARWKIGVAGWQAYGRFIKPPNTAEIGVEGGLATTADGCGLAFNMECFGLRGMFSNVDARAGLGDMEACLWAISRGWGVYGLQAESRHYAGAIPWRQNARLTHNLPMLEGVDAIGQYMHLFPIEAREGAIYAGERRIEVGR